MATWSLAAEYLAFILTVVTALFYYDRSKVRTHQRTQFWICLGLVAVSVLFDIASVWAFDSGENHFATLFLALNTAYYISSIAMSIAITAYLVKRLFDYVYDDYGSKRAIISLLVMGAAYLVLFAVNAFNGCLFSLDSQGNYVRGPYILLVYFAPLYGIALLAFNYIKNRRNVSLAMTRIVLAAPAITLLLVVFQVMAPEQLLNGLIGALVNLVCFISFQSVRTESDSLTGVSNRQAFINELALRTDGKQGYQIILVALRHFAQVNHIYSHAGGDAVLYLVANTLRELVPEGKVFRYNSVEFLLLIPSANEQQQELRLQHVVDRMERRWRLGQSDIAVQYCIAELCNAGSRWTTEEVVESLDYSIQLAKDQHKRLVRFDAETIRLYEREEELQHTIKRSLRKGLFEVYYQPVFYKRSNSFESCEALLRLTDPEGNRISPAEFIPVAERNGLIDQLTLVVLEDVCRLLSSGEAPGLKSVSVNFTMRQLLEGELAPRILSLLEKYALDPSRLKLEITERMIAENETEARNAMDAMNRSGLKFMLDDFGTGYSNFSSVINLPFECVKLDRSLVSGLPEEHKSKLMAQTLTPFFHELGMDVLAEGIETEEQANMVLSFGADRIQGYYYARPMPASDVCEWYASKIKRVQLD